jgi:hypothetical protein
MESKNKHGRTSLIHAAANGHMDCVRLLIATGADQEAKDNQGMSALAWAQRNEKHGVVRLIAASSKSIFGDMMMDLRRRSRFMGRACHNCFKTNKEMSRCGLCLKARYCSKECQMNHWPRHKTTCDRGGKQASSQRCSEVCSAGSSSPIVHQHGNMLANIPTPGSKLNVCHGCANPRASVSNRLKRCDRCRSVAYCSVQCQRNDWNAHKKECAKPAKQSE